MPKASKKKSAKQKEKIETLEGEYMAYQAKLIELEHGYSPLSHLLAMKIKSPQQATTAACSCFSM